jgi:hypothetical protein
MAKREIILPLARLSYPVFGAPEEFKAGDGKFRWGCSLWVPKSNDIGPADILKQGIKNTDTLALVDKTIRAVAAEAWPKDHAKILPEVLLDRKGCCWIDGTRRNEAEAEGYWTLSAYRYKKDGRPKIVDSDLSPLYDDKNEIMPGKGGRMYAGCWVRAKVEIWTQDNKGGNGYGIRGGLLTVQYLRKGDAFGGAGAVSTDGFGAVEDGADADDIAD